MNEVYGVRTAGGVCLWGGAVTKVRELAGSQWPWQHDRTIGDTRAAVAWPTNKPAAEGCLAVGVLGVDRRLWLPVIERFKRTGTVFSDRGIEEGLAAKLVRMWSFGIHKVYAQCSEFEQAQVWYELIRRDEAFQRLPVQFEAMHDISQCLEVYREMAANVAHMPAIATEISAANERGETTPVAVAIAMLAMGFKMGPQAL